MRNKIISGLSGLILLTESLFGVPVFAQEKSNLPKGVPERFVHYRYEILSKKTALLPFSCNGVRGFLLGYVPFGGNRADVVEFYPLDKYGEISKVPTHYGFDVDGDGRFYADLGEIYADPLRNGLGGDEIRDFFTVLKPRPKETRI